MNAFHVSIETSVDPSCAVILLAQSVGPLGYPLAAAAAQLCVLAPRDVDFIGVPIRAPPDEFVAVPNRTFNSLLFMSFLKGDFLC